MTAKAWYEIEEGYDFLYAEYRPAGGEWTQIGSPIGGSTNDKWSNLRYTVPGGGPVEFRFRYQTDGGVHLAGAFIDDIVVKNGGTTLLSDDVESGANGWTADGGFKLSTGTEVASGDRYYLAENRTYVGYDATLAGGSVPVQRRADAAQLGGALPVPGRPAGVGGRRDVQRQQHHRARRARSRPPGRCPPGSVHLSRRHQAEQPPPAVRRHLRPSGDRRPCRCTSRSSSARARVRPWSTSRRPRRRTPASPRSPTSDPDAFFSADEPARWRVRRRPRRDRSPSPARTPAAP